MLIKNLKYFAFFLVSVMIAYIAMHWQSYFSYYHVFPVSYSSYDHPFIKTTVHGNPYTLGLQIGSRFPIFLQHTTLDSLDKQFQGTEIYHSIDGSQKETPYYLIPKLKVGDLTLKEVFAYQSNTENENSLGKFLGGEFNLLLDFPKDRIIACKHFSKLQKQGIADKDWKQVPFEIHRIGIVFLVDTDFGPCKLALTTSMTSSLSASIFPPSARLPYVSSSFILGGYQFPNVTFERIELPDAISEIDGFIGMDYLKEHTLYLDYANKMAYIAPPQRYFTRIPVTFSSHNDPIIETSLEQTNYYLKFDLGTAFSFSLAEEVLHKIKKTKYGSSKWYDFRGTLYESPIYIIPEIKIGNLKFSQVFINQDRQEFQFNTTLIGEPLHFSGVIGLPILQKYNLFLDFPRSALYASKDLLRLQEEGLFSSCFLTTAFTLHPDGILLSVETDRGIYRLILDTGTTSTAIRAPHPSSTKKFQIGGHDFGSCFIMPLEINSQFDFDGCIGMDFLRKHPLFIDYSNKLIFIDLKSSK